MDNIAPGVAQVFGQRLRSLRIARQVSQEVFSESIGISQTYLSAIERGIKFPGPRTIEAIAKTLQVPYQDLFLLETPSRPENDVESLATAVAEQVATVVTRWLEVRGVEVPRSP